MAWERGYDIHDGRSENLHYQWEFFHSQKLETNVILPLSLPSPSPPPLPPSSLPHVLPPVSEYWFPEVVEGVSTNNKNRSGKLS